MNILLIVSTSICAIANVIPFITEYIISWIFSENKNEKQLKLEVSKLEQEMSVISMVEEFSKYTKIQRKHSKLKEIYKNQYCTRLSSRLKTQLFFNYSAKFFNAIIMIILVKMYRTQPIIILPRDTLWPLNDLFSWPGTDQDSISLLIWIGITTLVLPRLFFKINSV
ncbi:hypothetical protein PV327_004042 [Microctonus hyperodae]|uniref:Guided entry of tail-anchored proteins factor 1 n=1 Tax=Microctonus hyperodae TaxID=165561 RepID=A0AA39L1I3_MICHY|nr:hypothetical protein PV327_004042 [Microctonus hyperodae]